ARPQDHLQSPDDLGLVVDDQDLGRGRAHAAGAGCGTSGKVTANAVSSLTPDCRAMRPPLASTKPRAIASPSPDPRDERDPRTNGSKIRALSDGGTPRPRSITRTVTWPPAAPPVTRTATSGGECWTALSIRLANTRSTCTWSARTSGRSSGSSRSIGCSEPPARTCAAAAAAASPRSHQSERGLAAPAW